MSTIELMRDRLSEVREGKKEATDLFWAFWHPLAVKRSEYFFPKDQEEGENAALEAMELFLKAIRESTNGIVLPNFFNKIVTNHFRNHYNRLKLGPKILYGEEPGGEGEEGTEYCKFEGEDHLDIKTIYEEIYDYPYSGVDVSPEENAIKASNIKELRAGLFPADRDVFDLLDEGYEYAQIADELEKPMTAIYASLSRIASMRDKID